MEVEKQDKSRKSSKSSSKSSLKSSSSGSSKRSTKERVVAEKLKVAELINRSFIHTKKDRSRTTSRNT